MNTLFIILFILSLLISAVAKAIMDTLKNAMMSSVFKYKGQSLWWNPALSWRNKWKNGIQSDGERFPGSSTIFVSFTDAWHLFQHFFLFFLFTAMILYPHTINTTWSWWILLHFVGIYALFTVFFQITYWILNK